MATTTTRQYREPFVETAGIALTEAALPYLKRKINTASYTGDKFIADQTDLEKQALEQAATLEAGPEAYKAYMSPYQQEVIDTSIAALQREQAKGLGALRQKAAQAGAFGGGRDAVQMGEYQATSDIARAQLEAQLRQQGFQQAQQAAIQGLQAQQGLGIYQTQLGAQQRGVEQAQLSAQQEAAREKAFEPFTRLGLIGPQLASVIGGFPAQTQATTTPPPSATQQLLGLGIGAAGLGGAIKSLF